jgi:hypothetical protein
MPVKPSRRSARRAFLKQFPTAVAAGLATPSLGGTQSAPSSEAVTVDVLGTAQQLAGLDLPVSEREQARTLVAPNRDQYESLRKVPIAGDVEPAFSFRPLRVARASKASSNGRGTASGRTSSLERGNGKRPENLEELAFEPITVLADLLASKKVSATELTEMYLARLERHDPTLVCVVTLTKDLARREAEEADREIRAGLHRLTCEHVWRGRAAIHLRPREPSRLHDAQMDAGQGRAAHSVGDRVRCVRCVGCVRSGVCGT